MLKFSLGSLRSRAIALVLLAILPLLALTLYSYFDQRDRAVRQLQENELVTARNLANVQENLFSAARDLLTTLARLPQVQRLDREACDLLFSKLMDQSPYYTALVAADRNGQVFASAPAVKELVNVADRFFFQKAVETRSFVLGEPVLGRITQKYNINLAYPILNDAGQLQGVLTAGVDLSWLGSLLGKNDLPPSTALVLSNATGKVLFRYPEPQKYIGRMTPDILVKALITRDEAVAAGVGLPGDERLFASVRLSPPWQEMWVFIGLPRDWAVGPVNRLLWRNLVWLGLVALFAVAAAWYGGDLFIVRPVRKLQTITGRLAAGDLSVRAGPDYAKGELGLLANSFDQMADSLQDREAALKESEERLRLFIEHAPASLAMFDKEMRYLSVSRRWLSDYSLGDLDIIGLSHYEVFPEIAERWKKIHRRGLAGEVVRAEADPFERAGGSVLWLKWEVRPWYDASGVVAGIVIFTEDITERKRAEEALKQRTAELERSNRELEEFAYISSHDMQEPLRQISNFSEILAKGYQDRLDDQGLYYFGFITSGAKHMQALINDLLSYSRVGQAEITQVPTSLEAVLKGTINDLNPLIQESGAKISHDPLPTLKVNPNQMGQLLQNLIANAIKFRNKQSPRIHLSARQEDGEWLISVRDNGIGFNHNYAEKIFKVFKRMHSEEKYPGTGIGLAICKKIVERHGGRIWAESEPGRSATFYFTIPA